LPTIEESARTLAAYLRGESAAELLGTDQEPREVLAIRDSLLDVAELVDSIAVDPEGAPVPGWLANASEELTREELITTLTRARWVAWTATSALIATTSAAANVAATYAPVDSD
jgi:hypothetical protein